jgi:predicted short-subunit dehydrogenase-like oxidoreductase (DUF2520 family)
MTPDEKLCSALAKAKHIGPEIIAMLHGAFHDGHRLPEDIVAERVTGARRYAEQLLVAVLAVEQAIASRAAAAPANDVLEPFPGEGAYM